jgi:hypothetical protein
MTIKKFITGCGVWARSWPQGGLDNVIAGWGLGVASTVFIVLLVCGKWLACSCLVGGAVLGSFIGYVIGGGEAFKRMAILLQRTVLGLEAREQEQEQQLHSGPRGQA